MKVHNIPNHEEFFGLIDNELDDEEFEAEEEDEKRKKLLAILLSLFYEFYLLHKYDTEHYIVSLAFEEEMNEFNTMLKDNVLLLFKHYLEDVQTELDDKYNLPIGTVDVTIDIENALNSGIDAVTNTLYSDLKNKADFFKDINTTGSFSVHSNFRRAVKKLVNVVDFTAQSVEKMVERDYLAFVHGQEALYYWKVSGINTCAWCYEMEAMGAMPLSWFPIDHVNGRCWLEPANPDEFSDEYRDLQGW